MKIVKGGTTIGLYNGFNRGENTVQGSGQIEKGQDWRGEGGNKEMNRYNRFPSRWQML